jgi:hypothetical protein
MGSRNTLIVTAVIAALGAPVAAGANKTAGTTTEITLRIPDESAPAGAMVQMKVLTTEVTPISGGRPSFGFDALFSAAAGFAIAAPNGEIAGAAVVNGSHVQIFYDGTSLLTANYPILTTVLQIRPDAPVGSSTQFTLDPGSLWNFSTTGPTVASISPGTVTVGGSDAVAINDVVPGEGVWPAGTAVSVRGAGFTTRTTLKVNDAPVKGYTFISPTEMQFVLLQPFEVRGLRITVSGKVNSSTYYAYMRGITTRLSSRPLLAMTEPIFSVAQRTAATFGPIPQLAGNQYQAVAVQNPTMGEVTVGVALYAADGTLIHQTSTPLASRNRLTLEVSELLDGVAPPAGSSVVVTASAPIDAIALLCDEGVGTIVPSLPREAQP